MESKAQKNNRAGDPCPILKARTVRAAAGAALATGGAETPTEISGDPPRRAGWTASSKALAGRRLRHAQATIMVRPQRTKN